MKRKNYPFEKSVRIFLYQIRIFVNIRGCNLQRENCANAKRKPATRISRRLVVKEHCANSI